MKNITIGFLLATCIFLMIGTTQEMFVTTSDNGRYQGFANDYGKYMMDTQTGTIYDYALLGKNKKRWVKISSETNWIVE